MSVYLDASVLVALFANDSLTGAEVLTAAIPKARAEVEALAGAA